MHCLSEPHRGRYQWRCVLTPKGVISPRLWVQFHDNCARKARRLTIRPHVLLFFMKRHVVLTAFSLFLGLAAEQGAMPAPVPSPQSPA
jgi:hypothetical protein